MAIDGDFPSRGRTVFIVTTVTFILTTLFVIGRIISRFVILRNRTWDDWLMILAWFFAFGLSSTINFAAWRGLGRHDVDIPKEWLPALRQTGYAFSILYNPSLMATKSSILVFYLRMSKNTQKFLRRASYATLALINIKGPVMTFLYIFQCSPVAAAYKFNIPSKCMPLVTLYLCSAPVSTVANLAILVLPIPLLTGMRLPIQQKTILVLTFSLGIFVTVIDIVRIYYLQRASDIQDGLNDEKHLGDVTDFAWNASLSLMWSSVEVNVGIICACVPTLKPLIRRILPSMIADPIRNGTWKTSSMGTQLQGSTIQHTSSSGVLVPAPTTAGKLNSMPGREMNMMDFLSTPESNGAAPDAEMARKQSRPIMPRMQTDASTTSVYFGLIEMKRPKSMLETRGMESFKYCAVVTVLFFLWGFSYGLLNALNNQIYLVTNENIAQRIGLSSSYFVGYLFGPITVGQWVLHKGGFKATFITGLSIYAIGALMFWPCAVLRSWPGFLICQFVVGFALAILETAANPFVVLCGPSRHAEYRLLLSQGIQGVGSVVSQVFGQRVLFDNLHADSLLDVQWAYLAAALVSVVLALFFYYVPLPEAKDDELQILAENLSIHPSQTVGSTRLPLIYTTGFIAIACQFLYVAVQEGNATWSESLLKSLSQVSPLIMESRDYTLIAGTLFAISRLIFAFLCLIIAPRILLLTCFLLGTLSIVLTYTLRLSVEGTAGCLLAFSFFEGPVFPLIFAMGIRGMGRWTKWFAAVMISSVSGGAFLPFAMWVIQRTHSVQSSYCLIVALFSAGILFPIYLNLVGSARRQTDSARHQVDSAVAPTLGNPPIDIGDREVVLTRRSCGGLWGKKRGSSFVEVVELRGRRTSEAVLL